MPVPEREDTSNKPLKLYPNTLDLKTKVHLRDNRTRRYIESDS
jgi:hypothetical protein